METISLKVPESLSARLTQTAQRQNRSKSEVIRDAVDMYLRSEGTASAESAFSLSSDLAGILSGPKDLSTNKEHMEGFGR